MAIFQVSAKLGSSLLFEPVTNHPFLAFLLSFLAYGFILTVYRLFFSPLSAVPGPKLAAVTRLWILYHDYQDQRTDIVTDLHRKYGPVVRLAPNEVSFTSTIAVKDIYTGSGRESGFPKGFLYAMFTHYGRYNMFSSLTSEAHSWRRRMIASSYSLTNILNREASRGDIWRTVGEYVKYVRREGSESKNGPGRSIDIYPANIYFACDNVSAHVFGEERGTKTLGSLVDSAEIKLQRDSIDDWYVPTRREKIYLWTDFNVALRCFEAFERTTQKVIRIIQRRVDPDSKYIGGTFLHNYAYKNMRELKDRPSVELTVAKNLLSGKVSGKVSEVFDEYGAASESMDHMLAGMDTTSDTLSFLLAMLSLPEHHEYQETIRSSLPDLCPFDQPLTVADINQILNNTYLNSVIKETLLIFPAIPVTLPRVVPSGGRVVDGLWLPAGTLASSSVRAVNLTFLPEFEKNPGNVQWKPSRWLVKSDADKDRVQELERRLWSFGSGGRGCIGKHLALTEMSLLLAAILANFKLRRDDDDNNDALETPHSHWTCRRSFRDIAYLQDFHGFLRFEPL
ncbi:hypothetical protein TWF102_004807 [Orbilia oligospora]|uniref:Benzoate 4-monooxygenase cytochrome P450 n=1 Tax=Orbilia oligospora TaxID=2813651 RepID=A0A7C8J842_ORBOL|nr:hypothetical protein TWF706_006564 [Orbilia oligospora]KAF3101557.1 hypothetical protein TWF102_004807 [Orbilia oligospora]KAF3105570.1 hypothetical protein TWF103_006628 [Orbilia oligospora]